jgi:hypothetical protein
VPKGNWFRTESSRGLQEYGNELQGSIKRGRFLAQFSKYHSFMDSPASGES